jgi:hypothetical protein
MSIEIVKSVNGVPVRITDERWVHIVENHDDLAGYYDEILDVVEYPDHVIRGYRGALIALRRVREGKFLAVVYKETSDKDGFIITAYFTSKIELEREVIVWQQRR